MIKIKNVYKKYDDQKIVENLSLEIQEGNIFGFLGPNGAGKTTAMKLVVGLNQSDKGSIFVGDLDMQKNKNREIIGYMPEDPYFYDQLSAKEFLRFISRLFTNSEYEKNVDKILKLVGLFKTKNKKIGHFSKGMKQRLGLSQALINDPKYLFLDEPLDGLDPVGRREFKKILLSLKKEGKTIFFNSHVLSDVEEICDQIGIINKGKLIYSGPVKKFRGNKSLEDAFVEKLLK